MSYSYYNREHKFESNIYLGSRCKYCGLLEYQRTMSSYCPMHPDTEKKECDHEWKKFYTTQKYEQVMVCLKCGIEKSEGKEYCPCTLCSKHKPLNTVDYYTKSEVDARIEEMKKKEGEFQKDVLGLLEKMAIAIHMKKILKNITRKKYF